MSQRNIFSLIYGSGEVSDSEFEEIDSDESSKSSVCITPSYMWFCISGKGKTLILIEARDSFTARKLSFDEFGVDEVPSLKFLNYKEMLDTLAITDYDIKNSRDPIIWIRDKDRKISRSHMDGMNCYECGSFYPMAIANHPGGKLKCYSCKSG